MEHLFADSGLYTLNTNAVSELEMLMPRKALVPIAPASMAPKAVNLTDKTAKPVNEYNTGRWSDAEHNLFVSAGLKYGLTNWKEIATMVPTRSARQIRCHAQKYYKKIDRAIDEAEERMTESNRKREREKSLLSIDEAEADMSALFQEKKRSKSNGPPTCDDLLSTDADTELMAFLNDVSHTLFPNLQTHGLDPIPLGSPPASSDKAFDPILLSALF